MGPRQALRYTRTSGSRVCPFTEIFGTQAKASDLLQAIALCVTGTYRKVGPAYILTSDITGMGVRKLKFAAWKQNVDNEVNRRENAWRAAVVQSGVLAKIGFDSKDRYAPDDQTSRDLEAVDDQLMQTFQYDLVPASDLTQDMRSLLTKYAAQDPSRYMVNKVGLHSNIEFSFVLPGGQALRPERSTLGERVMFKLAVTARPQKPVTADSFVFNPQGKQALIVKAETASEAELAVKQARLHGFLAIWLDTHQSAAIKAAENHGVKVSLVIRPWEATAVDSETTCKIAMCWVTPVRNLPSGGTRNRPGRNSSGSRTLPAGLAHGQSMI